MDNPNPIQTKLAGLKDVEVARAVGVTRQAVGLWKRGTLPTGPNLLRLAEYLKVSPADLLPGRAA